MIRYKIINWGVNLLFLSLFLGIMALEVINTAKYKELSNKNCIRLLPQEGSRGRILDCNGNIVVDNELCFDVMLMPQTNSLSDKLLLKVSQILGIRLEELKKKLKEGFIGASIPVTIAKDIDIKKAITLEELKNDLGNIFIQPRPVRYYPQARVASHLIGYLSEIDRSRLTKLADYGYKTKDIIGFGGIEERYDYYLRQEEGGLSFEVDHRGRPMRTLGFRPPHNGGDIQITLDLRIQKIAEENLSQRVGSVIIMDPNDGQILAMASNPNFDPSVFIKKKSDFSIRNLFNDPDAPLINRSISASYPAGSVFKLIVATAALETGKVDLAKSFFCPGRINIGKREFSCWDTHNQQNLIQAIAHSCNVFFYKTGLLIGPEAIHDYALRFGFAKATSIDLPYETGGFLPNPLWMKIYKFKSWFDGDTANFSIGQGSLLVTPIQITRMMAVFANRGSLVTPYIVKAIDTQDISNYQKRILKLPIKDSTIEYIRQGLRDVIVSPSGTANNLSALAVSVAGKTGTAQAPPGPPHAWFVGFFPFKNPKFVICVFLERGGAGVVASTLARQIIESMVKQGLI